MCKLSTVYYRKFTSMIRRKKLLLATVLALMLLSAFTFGDKYFKITQSISIFSTMYKEVFTYYVEDVNPNKLMQTSIDAMLQSLDPYTNYISEDRIEDYRTLNTGEYGGIGASTVRIEGKTYISMIFEGYPAQNSDLTIGDEVIAINHVDITRKSKDDISQLMKGQKESEVVITVNRFGKNNPLNISVSREKITIENVPYYGLMDGNTGYIKLNEFTMNASGNVKKALLELKKQGAENFILDLRGNPGGLLIESVKLSNLFLPKGVPIVSTKGKVEENDTEYISRFNPIELNAPIVVLINSQSASASEIVAGVIQDYDRGVIVGHKSYGKGLVQTTRRLSYNAQLKVTTAKYYIPSGRCIQALDYSNRRPDGSVGNVPDSLISEFRTQNGRVVFDGGGVDPDIKIDQDAAPVITKQLTQKGFIFQYATEYFYSNSTIAPATDFHLSNAEYSHFVKWVQKEEFEYVTEVEKNLLNIKKSAKSEGNWKEIEKQYEELKHNISVQKSNDFITFKSQILRLLENEIVSRYYLQRGAIEAGFGEDLFVSKAVDILNDPSAYSKILN